MASLGTGRTQDRVCPGESGPHRGGGQGRAGALGRPGVPVRCGKPCMGLGADSGPCCPLREAHEEATPRSCPDGRGKLGTNTAGGQEAETQGSEPPSAQATFWKRVRELLLGFPIYFYIEEHCKLWFGPRLAVRPAMELKCSASVTARRNPCPGTLAAPHGLEVTTCGGHLGPGWAWASREPWQAGRGRCPMGSHWPGARGRDTLPEEPEVGLRGQRGLRRTGGRGGKAGGCRSGPSGKPVTEGSLQGTLPSPPVAASAQGSHAGFPPPAPIPQPAPPHPPRFMGRRPASLEPHRVRTSVSWPSTPSPGEELSGVCVWGTEQGQAYSGMSQGSASGSHAHMVISDP